MSSQKQARELIRDVLLAGQRRSAMRFPLDVPVVFWWQDAKGEHQEGEGRVYDISERGVFVLASVCPPAHSQVGAKISITAIPDVPRGLRMQVEGRVLRVERVESGDRRDGFAIVSGRAILHEEEKALRERDSAGGTTQQRSWW